MRRARPKAGGAAAAPERTAGADPMISVEAQPSKRRWELWARFHTKGEAFDALPRARRYYAGRDTRYRIIDETGGKRVVLLESDV